jgi:putative phage-type endonuclease
MKPQDRINILNKLKEKPFVKQRSEEWFKLRETRLTASDLHDAIYHPSSLIKKKIKNASFNSYAIPALRWGCMFERVAINIYAHMNKTNINEFGLLINDNINNFGASPDGISDEGIMIEIKCPYSRVIKDKEIPDKYYYQMQGQMAVCELDVCDYIECKFSTFENKDDYESNANDLENYKHGIIEDFKNGNYRYSTPNQTVEENLKEMADATNNCIYWKLDLINVQRVEFDKELWDSKIKPNISSYWSSYEQEVSELKHKKKNQFIEDDD